MEKRAVLYCRISQEDRQAGESVSIQGQRELLRSYLATHPMPKGWKTEEIIDDGYSGTSFDRPGMCRLLDMAKKGEIGCILVKDLSRFGREYVEAGYWIEQMFPRLGIQLIAVNERCGAVEPGLNTALQNMIHTLYSRDLSRKVSSARKIRMQQGAFTSPTALFGYQKAAEHPGCLEPLPETADIVRVIFCRAQNGAGATEIARILNREKQPTPLVYKNQAQGKPVPENAFWTADAVRRILRDERYTGVMVCGKRRRQAAGSTQKIAREEWIRVPNTHPAIVTREVFEQAQQVLRTMKETDAPGRRAAGLIRCGHCGYTMRRRNGANSYYYCDTGRHTDGADCAKLRMDCAQIHAALKESLVAFARLAYGKEAVALIQEKKATVSAAQAKLKNAKRREEKCLQAQKCSLYEQMKEGMLSREEFAILRKRLEETMPSTISDEYQSFLEWEQLFSIGILSEELMIDLLKTFTKIVYFNNENCIRLILEWSNISKI